MENVWKVFPILKIPASSCPTMTIIPHWHGLCNHSPLHLNHNTCILEAVDQFYKARHLIHFRRLHTALEMAEALFYHLFSTSGLLEDIVTNQGQQFIFQVLCSFFNLLEIYISLYSGYYLQTNGQTEHTIQEISSFLRTYYHRKAVNIL